jgi:hypothetical protein
VAWASCPSRRWKRLSLMAKMAMPLSLVSCAKFPANGTASNVTRVTFMMRVQGKINTTQDDDPLTSDYYFVAIRASSEDNPDPTTNPQPVFSAPHPNGFVQGQCTHFVQFETANPNAPYPYTLWRFPDPIGLSGPQQLNSPIINFTRPDPGTGTLRFDLFVNQLGDPATLKFLQVNFFTMNKLARETTSGRLQDYLGDSGDPLDVNKAITIDLRTNTIRQNDGNYEPAGDCPDPDLDIVDWSIQVTRP